MKSGLQLMAINLLNFKYRFLFSIFISLIIFLTFKESCAFCSNENPDEYVKFLEKEAWELDSRISDLENRISILEHKLEDLTHTVVEQKTVIAVQQELLIRIDTPGNQVSTDIQATKSEKS